MIRKYLTVGKRLSLCTSKPEEESSHARVLELNLPLDTYWTMSSVLAKADGAIAERDEDLDLLDLYGQVLQMAAPYALHEVDRLWIYQHYQSLVPK